MNTDNGYEEAKQAVRAGVRLLNLRGPEDWSDRVDWDGLDISDPILCVLGQVYGSYGEGLEALGLRYSRSSVRHGFSSAAYPASWEQLQDAWLAEMGYF